MTAVGAVALTVFILSAGCAGSPSPESPTDSSERVTALQLGPKPLEVARPERGTTFVAFIGDALSAGRGASAFGRGFRPQLVEAWRSGGHIDPIVTTLENGALAEVVNRANIPAKSSLVIIELGTTIGTDTPMGPEVFRQLYRQLIGKVRTSAPGAAVLCLGTWRAAEDAAVLDGVIYDECQADNSKFVQITDVYQQPDSRGPAGRPAYLGGGVGDTFYPNDSGHDAIARRVMESVKVLD